MSEWRESWPNGLPSEGRSPKSGHRMAAEGMPFPWRWNGDTISLNLGVIWEMSVQTFCSDSGTFFTAHPPSQDHFGSGIGLSASVRRYAITAILFERSRIVP